MRLPFVHEWFIETAERHPHLTAVECGCRRVRYGALHGWSNRMAGLLREAGAEPGDRVAILTADRVATIAAVLGALHAGCAFVPIDPDLPEARIQTMLRACGARWTLYRDGEQEALGRLGAEGGVRLCMADESGEPGEEVEPANWGGEDLCYVYFTSGSTGVPKGIGGRLKAIDHYVRWEIGAMEVGPGTRVSQLTTPAFDAYLRDVFVPLCAGGTVCIPEQRETVLEGGQLAEWIDQEGIEIVHCVPSVLRRWLGEGAGKGFQRLRNVLVAGERLVGADVRSWQEVLGERVRLVNLYGPSETTMTKFVYYVQAEDRDRGSVPIGKPMEGARALVLDELGQPVAGVGEIYIRTPYRSLGYYGQPELTAEVFVANPLTGNASDVVYRTGDLGRVLEDGNFEFLGRRDQQVKIRGVRIELGEVESALRKTGLVREAVVVDVEEEGGEKRLCGYVVLEEGAGIDELRQEVRRLLPDYMTPGQYVSLERLPLLPNGKIDRKSLPAPPPPGVSDKTFAPPRTPVEEIIAGAWCELLECSRVSRFDNFFDVGGHSLAGARVIARIRSALQIDVPLRLLLESPNLASMAAAIESSLEAGSRVHEKPIKPRRNRERAPLSHGQRQLWLVDQLQPGNPAYNLSFAVRLTGALNIQAVRRSLNELIRRHEVLRTTFPAHDGAPFQKISPPRCIGLPIIDLAHSGERAGVELARRLVREQAGRGFNLSDGPLFRPALVRIDTEQYILSATMHHIISDGWSSTIMVREFGTLYSAFDAGQTSPLPELRLQYADFAEWQRDSVEDEVVNEQLSFWRNHLADAPPLNIPTDYARRPGGVHPSATVTWSLSPQSTAMLNHFSRSQGSTLFMTLLAAFQLVLGRHAASADVTVGTFVANRDRIEFEPLIGFFVNTLLLRADLSGDPTFAEFLARVRKLVFEAYAHKDVPFERVVDHLALTRDEEALPFQAAMVLQNTPKQDLQMPKLRMRGFGSARESAKFDLMLFLDEGESGLLGILEYASDLFKPSTVHRLMEEYRRLLETIPAQASVPIWEIALPDRSQSEESPGAFADDLTLLESELCAG
jgi:amino acid adenylation domain-containing protein